MFRGSTHCYYFSICLCKANVQQILHWETVTSQRELLTKRCNLPPKAVIPERVPTSLSFMVTAFNGMQYIINKLDMIQNIMGSWEWVDSLLAERHQDPQASVRAAAISFAWAWLPVIFPSAANWLFSSSLTGTNNFLYVFTVCGYLPHHPPAQPLALSWLLIFCFCCWWWQGVCVCVEALASVSCFCCSNLHFQILAPDT